MSAIVYSLNTFRKTRSQSASVLNVVRETEAYSNPTKYGKTFKQFMKCIEARFYDYEELIYHSPVSGMKLDSYGHGNAHNSVFQYMPKSKTNWNNPIPKLSDLRKVFKAIYKNRGKVMVLGHKSDPFMWLDHKYKQTQKILRFANRYGVQLVINTMSDLCAHDDYIALIKAGNHSITMNMSLNDGNDRIERLLSPGAPSMKRRQSAIDKLKSAGIEVSIRETKSLIVDHEISIRTGYGTGYILKPYGQDLNERGAK